MKILNIRIFPELDVDEYTKAINFVSEKIIDIKKQNESLQILLEDSADLNEIETAINTLTYKFKKTQTVLEIFYENNRKIKKFFDPYENNDNIIYFSNCQIGFNKKGIFLLNYFDNNFKNFALEENAIEKRYPVLMDLKNYLKTGYIKKSPQYVILCSSPKENIKVLENFNECLSYNNGVKQLKEPEFALSPSACFHTYVEYQNQKLKSNTLITFNQNVFRNEGRLNYKEKGRLMDYNVREIVMIGNERYVDQMRKLMMDKTVTFMKKLNLIGNITLASDSFILPKMQLYKTIQIYDKSKYEVHLSTSNNSRISVASFNLHGHAFTDPFNISVKGCNDTVTGCVGFGIQRWVIDRKSVV